MAASKAKRRKRSRPSPTRSANKKTVRPSKKAAPNRNRKRPAGSASRRPEKPKKRVTRGESGNGKPGRVSAQADKAGPPPSLLGVGLTVHVADGMTRDSAEIRLLGAVSARSSRQDKSSPSLRDRETAARRVSRGLKPTAVAGLLAALAHSQRIAILVKLLPGEANHQLLAKTTGLKAGPLYHHLRELRSAGLIGPKVRDVYQLTRKGRRAILAVLAIGRLCR